MLETGMRVSDAIRFNPKHLERGSSGLWVYSYVQRKMKATKRPEAIEAYLSDRLKNEIDQTKLDVPRVTVLVRHGGAGLSAGVSSLQTDVVGGQAVRDSRLPPAPPTGHFRCQRPSSRG